MKPAATATGGPSGSRAARPIDCAVKGAPGTVIYTAVGPGRNPADRVPMVIVRRHGTQTVFDCRHEFGVVD